MHFRWLNKDSDISLDQDQFSGAIKTEGLLHIALWCLAAVVATCLGASLPGRTPLCKIVDLNKLLGVKYDPAKTHQSGQNPVNWRLAYHLTML